MQVFDFFAKARPMYLNNTMSSRKILILSMVLPTLAMAVYSIKHSGKPCGGENANLKEYQCPRLYECVLESNKPNATGVCRFLPNGLRLGAQPAQGNVVVENPPEKDPSVEYDTQTKKAQRLTLAQNKFGFQLLKTLAYTDQTNSQNIAISPTSMGLAFNILFNGSYGATKDQLANVLQLSGFSLYQLNEASKILLDRLTAPAQGITSNLTNSIWIRDGIILNPSVLNDAQAFYGAQITNLDFNQPQASKTINDWVYGNTGGKISGVVPEQIDPATVSYIINTAYFNAIWKYKFDAAKVAERDFYKQDGSKSPVATMEMARKDFLYFEDDYLQAVKLPYGADQKYSMVVLLPKELGVNNLLGKFDIVTWQGWLKGFEEREGTLYLPKFKLDYGGSMVSALKEISMVLPFDAEKADFSKLSADGVSKEYFVSDVVHKTYIDVNEEGTEAVAVTSIEVGITSAKPVKPEGLPFVMDINKPFFFAIVNEETQANLFVGIVRGL